MPSDLKNRSVKIRSARSESAWLLIEVSPESEDCASFTTTLKTHDFEGVVHLYSFEAEAHPPYHLFENIDASWPRWPGEITWSSVEGTLLFSATSTSRGNVMLAVTLIKYERDWSTRLTSAIEIEGGSIQKIAADLRVAFRV